MTATCSKCQGECRLTSGEEVYPHRGDLASKPIYVCDQCKTRVGCHPGTLKPLGFAADAETRKARIILHNQMIDPLWKGKGKKMRGCVYRFLGYHMGLTPDQTHTGMFTIEQCRQAWTVLRDETTESIRQWCLDQGPAKPTR